MSVTTLEPSQMDAYSIIKALLDSADLGSLADDLFGFIQQGYSADTIQLLLQETAEWKQRFAGNEKRKQAGLPILAPGEYLAVEASYRQVMRTFGLPSGFYDSYSDFADAIGADISPQELQARLTQRQLVVESGELSGVAAYMRAHYGLSTGDAVAYFTDPTRALPLLEKQVRASEIGAAARTATFGELDPLVAMRLAERGITEDSALGKFAEIAGMSELTRQLPGQGGPTVTRDELITAAFEGNATAQQQIVQTSKARAAQFAGGGSFATTKEGTSI